MENLLATLLLFFGSLSVLAAVPQLIKLVKIKNSDEFSQLTWIVWLSYQIVAVLYTLEIEAYAYVLINSLWTLFYLIMVILIYKYRPKKLKS